MITILASAPGAAAQYIGIRVTEPLPGQLPDPFEPDDVRTVGKSIDVNGKVQTRTLHTRGEADWISFEATPGYRYAIAAAGDLNPRVHLHNGNGESLEEYEGKGEFVFDGSRKEILYLSVREMDGRQGIYRLSVQGRRSARLEIATDSDLIAGDGSDFATLQVRLVDLDGAVLDSDNTTQVAFEIVEGEGNLTTDEGIASDGIVTTSLTTGESGSIIVQASAEGMEPVRLSVGSTPAIVLESTTAPPSSVAARDLIRVNLVAASGANGIVGFRAGLSYDPAQLEFVDFEVDGLMDAGTHLISRSDRGEVVINAAILGGTADADRGLLGRATFRVLDAFLGKTELRLVSAWYGDLSGLQELKIGTEKGSLVVGVAKPDPITISDFQAAFGEGKGDPAFDYRMDLNGDGIIDFADFLLFIQELEGSSE